MILTKQHFREKNNDNKIKIIYVGTESGYCGYTT